MKHVAKKTQTKRKNIVPENNLSFSKTCNIYRRGKKIMEVKYRRNITFLGEKIVESDMKDNTYGNVAQKAIPVSNNNNQLD